MGRVPFLVQAPPKFSLPCITNSVQCHVFCVTCLVEAIYGAMCGRAGGAGGGLGRAVFIAENGMLVLLLMIALCCPCGVYFQLIWSFSITARS